MCLSGKMATHSKDSGGVERRKKGLYGKECGGGFVATWGDRKGDCGNLARPNVFFAIKCGRVEMYISVLWMRNP
jgi:hypothetical protein